MSRLYPVILPLTAEDLALRGADRVKAQSRRAREALVLSCQASGVFAGPFLKDERNVPVPFHDTYWSISHKAHYVAAVVASVAVGIDLEEMMPRNPTLFDYIAGAGEWNLAPHRDWETFFRYWTAKEAILKAVGVGLKDLRQACVVAIPDSENLVIHYDGYQWPIRHFRFHNHMVSITHDREVSWTFAS